MCRRSFLLWSPRNSSSRHVYTPTARTYPFTVVFQKRGVGFHQASLSWEDIALSPGLRIEIRAYRYHPGDRIPRPLGQNF